MLISAGANFIHLFILPCLASSLPSPTGAQPSAALGHRAQLGEPLLFSGTVSLAQQLQAQPCAGSYSDCLFMFKGARGKVPN